MFGHCWDLLGFGGTVTGLRTEALQINKSFHPLCIELVTRDRMDHMVVHVELLDGRDTSPAEAVLMQAIKDSVGVTTEVRAGAPGSVARSQGKAVRVVDKRG